MNTKTGHLREGTFKSGLEGKVKIKWECGRCIRPFDLWYVLPEGLLERNKCMVTNIASQQGVKCLGVKELKKHACVSNRSSYANFYSGDY